MKNKKQTIVVSGVLKRKGEIFLARRPLTKKIAPGLYHLPGGHVEFGEHPVEALVREFQEEFKLNIVTKRIVRAFSYQNEDIHTIGITYEVESNTSLEEIWFDKKDNEEVVWSKEQDLGSYFPKHDHDYLTLLEYFSMYAS